ncbi:hypothetical protein [Vibrio casei]|nr:hypothetical protein [Vibrio casei]
MNEETGLSCVGQKDIYEKISETYCSSFHSMQRPMNALSSICSKR